MVKRLWKVPAIGTSHEMLTVTGKAYREADNAGIRRTFIPAKCECGTVTTVKQERWGKQVSCGCVATPRKPRSTSARVEPVPAVIPDDAQRYEYRGRVNTLDGWARITGIEAPILKRRIDRGMSLEDAILKPVER